MAQSVPRIQAMDILPAILSEKAEIYISKVEDENVSWTTYLKPFSLNLWFALIFVAMLISCVLTIIENIFNPTDRAVVYLTDFLTNLWVAFKANIGGKPSKVPKNIVHRIIMFDCLLVGMIVWIAYRASLTSELSVTDLKFPFNDLESLLKTDYKLVLLSYTLLFV